MYQPLAPCPSCRRHVRAGDQGECPFCAASLTVVGTVPSVVPSVRGRLARGALFAFATSVIASGCSSTETTSPGDAAIDTRPGDDSGGPAPAYGAPADDTGRPDDGTVDDTGTPMAKYGAPPPPDAGANG